jgi:golgi phosphoprotein 3
MLWLHEEILLLELDDQKGTARAGSSYAQAMGGAALAELLLAGRIRLSEDKHRRAEVVDRRPLGEPLLDDLLAGIVVARKAKAGHEWVAKVAGRGKLKDEVAGRLVAKGILREEEGRVLGVFPTRHYPEGDPLPERAVRQRLHDAIFSDTAPIDARTLVLVALADAAQLLPRVFDGAQLRPRRQRIADLVAGNAVRAVTKEAIAAVEAAIMVAAVMPAIIAVCASD